MRKRRRIFTPVRKTARQSIVENTLEYEDDNVDSEVSNARGRLKGALLEVLEPAAEESDASAEAIPTKRERQPSTDKNEDSDYDERSHRMVQQRQSYVLKLFDRSVDLSQFSENTPLYPICRAWIANQPKANYKEFGTDKSYEEPVTLEKSIDLPLPEGPPISRIPDLLPEQLNANKDNINLNYREAPPPTHDQLMGVHAARWAGVRRAWIARAALSEERYRATQQILNQINANAI